MKKLNFLALVVLVSISFLGIQTQPSQASDEMLISIIQPDGVKKATKVNLSQPLLKLRADLMNRNAGILPDDKFLIPSMGALSPRYEADVKVSEALDGKVLSFKLRGSTLPEALLFTLEDAYKLIKDKAEVEQRYADAQSEIKMYLEKQGVPENNVEAIKGLIEAAEQGDADAQYRLGEKYLDGEGVPKSHIEAVKWLTKAAKQEHPPAQFDLGLLYHNGQGVPQNDVEAAKWFTKAAGHGDCGGQFMLGEAYQKGAGVPQSNVEAVKWFVKAAEQEHYSAHYRLKLMVEQGNTDAIQGMSCMAQQTCADRRELKRQLEESEKTIATKTKETEDLKKELEQSQSAEQQAGERISDVNKRLENFQRDAGQQIEALKRQLAFSQEAEQRAGRDIEELKRQLAAEKEREEARARQLAVMEREKSKAAEEEKRIAALRPSIPLVAQGNEAIYERFLKGVLLYRPTKGSDVGMVTLPVKELANPLEGTFNLSRCGDTGKYLSIATGYRKGKKPENKDKIEIWFAPRFLIEKEQDGTASHFKPIMGNWKQELAPVGMFWTWGNSDDKGCYDYLTTETMDNLSKIDLYEHWRGATGSHVRRGIARVVFMFFSCFVCELK